MTYGAAQLVPPACRGTGVVRALSKLVPEGAAKNAATFAAGAVIHSAVESDKVPQAGRDFVIAPSAEIALM